MAALTPIGCSPLIDGAVQFFKQEMIVARLPGNADPVPVRLPEFTSSWSCSSDVKIARLMRNFHMQTVVEGGEVHVKPISNDKKEWKLHAHTLPLPSGVSAYMVRANGSISYTVFNTVTTWDYAQNGYSITSYKIAKITALAEDREGVLIVGDSKGNLAIDDRVVSTTVRKEVKRIIPLFHNFYILEFEDNSFVVFDLVTEQKVDVDIADKKFVCAWDEKFMCSQEEKMYVYTFDLISKACQQSAEVTIGRSASLFHIANTKAKVLERIPEIRESLQKIILHNLYEKTREELPDFNFKKDFLGKKVFCLDGQLAYVTLTEDRDRTNDVDLFLLREKKMSDPFQMPNLESGAMHCIDTFSVLSCNTIVCATKPPVKIYFGPTTGCFNTLDKKYESVTSLTELVDGSVAVRCLNHVVILKSQLKEAPSSIDPLSGLQAAIKTNDLYQARRYYEKASKQKPDTREPFEVFSSYLKSLPNKKFYREVLLQKYPAQLMHLKEKACKSRLMVGECGFSYTEALLDKHKATHSKLASAIIATELLLPTKDEVIERISSLTAQGVTVHFGIDARHVHEVFQGQRFKRIHWNCPFTGKGLPRNFKEVIPAFFLSASKLQLMGDRIHFTLMQEVDKDFWQTRQTDNSIVKGSTWAGYRLIRKRVFDAQRYPGYVHLKTDGTEHGEGKKSEFIFEKAIQGPTKKNLESANKLQDPKKKEYKIETGKPAPADESLPLGLEDYYFVASSDEDSSDYYDSD